MKTLMLAALVAFFSPFFSEGVVPVCVDTGGSSSCYGYPVQTPPLFGFWRTKCSEGNCILAECEKFVVVDGLWIDSVACSCGGTKESLPSCYPLFDEGLDVFGNWNFKFLGCVDNGCGQQSPCRSAVLFQYVCGCGI